MLLGTGFDFFHITYQGGKKVMCGMNWYREQLAKAEDNNQRLSELMKMMEDRYQISVDHPATWDKVHPDIIHVYKEIIQLLANENR